MRGELATIAALEYTVCKGRGGDWPVLHCHPLARGPFVPFDEKEKKRYLKAQRAEKERALEKEHTKAEMRAKRDEKRRQAQLHAKRSGDLRRSVSMNSLHRRVSEFGLDLNTNACDVPDSANASGYLASTGTGGYIAASGNSVGVTSTTGTTSTGLTLRHMQLPASLRGRIQQQVVTSRKVGAEKTSGMQTTGTMGPPVDFPVRNALLRKSRSTNTLRLEKRKEGEKPGYCESCRTKFDDFKAVSGLYASFMMFPDGFAACQL
jgi:regulatory subunit for Cdc7p protein kinase